VPEDGRGYKPITPERLHEVLQHLEKHHSSQFSLGDCHHLKEVLHSETAIKDQNVELTKVEISEVEGAIYIHIHEKTRGQWQAILDAVMCSCLRADACGYRCCYICFLTRLV
jgi:hypothetical protein